MRDLQGRNVSHGRSGGQQLVANRYQWIVAVDESGCVPFAWNAHHSSQLIDRRSHGFIVRGTRSNDSRLRQRSWKVR